MNNKYYTPTVEEFHIGFEYEELINFDMLSLRPKNHIDRIEWCKMDMKDIEFMSLNEIRSKLEFESIRVKYLDEEDIESLGLEFDGVTYKKIDNNGLRVFLWITPGMISIDKNTEDNPCTSSEYFRGTIKNKSELKRLLKQLNIQ